MSDAFVNGFCLTLVGKVPDRKMHIIRDALNSYILGFEIKPITTSVNITIHYAYTSAFKAEQDYKHYMR